MTQDLLAVDPEQLNPEELAAHVERLRLEWIAASTQKRVDHFLLETRWHAANKVLTRRQKG